MVAGVGGQPPCPQSKKCGHFFIKWTIFGNLNNCCMFYHFARIDLQTIKNPTFATLSILWSQNWQKWRAHKITKNGFWTYTWCVCVCCFSSFQAHPWQKKVVRPWKSGVWPCISCHFPTVWQLTTACVCVWCASQHYLVGVCVFLIWCFTVGHLYNMNQQGEVETDGEFCLYMHFS